MALFLVSLLGSDFIVGKWADDPNQGTSKFKFYTLLCFGGCFGQFIAMTIRSGVILMYSVTATKKLHGVILRSIFEAPLNLYFDTTPMGRILNRFSKDLTTLDTSFGFMLGSVVALFYRLFYTIMVAIIAVPWTALLLPVIFAWSFCLTRRVNKAIR
jgi:ABC-type multidrug transport system fused ATPase/permease subunit